MQTASIVRIANPSDEPELLHLFRLMHAEGGMRRLDIDCVRATFARAFNRQGGILAVIGSPGQIRAMQYLLISRYYYTTEHHIQELWNWVHPDHRKTDYCKLLIEHAKKCSDEISVEMGVKVPLIMGVMTPKRMAAKVRRYRMEFGMPVGAFFLYNAVWVTKDDLAEEDIWRVPSVSRVLLRRIEKVEKKERIRARV